MASSKGFDRGLADFGDRDFARYLRRAFVRSTGISGEMLERPIVGIVETGSGFNNCHRAMPELVTAVSRGVITGGALPVPFPTISISDIFANPTGLMFRNLMAMDTEEMIRAQPMDAVVLIGGCDNTVPAQLMGAVSAGIPAVQLVTGPMSTGRHRGEKLGACTDCRQFWSRYRADEVGQDEINQVEGRLVVTTGTCAVMGTASTMACVSETLGMSLPGSASIPAVYSDRLVAAEESGRLAAQLTRDPVVPADVITQNSLENAFRVLVAIGGSTNVIMHLVAIGARLGITIPPERLNKIFDETPVLVDLKPVGDAYMEDFHAAGGVGAVLRDLAPLLHLDTVDVTGTTLGDRLKEPLDWVDRSVIRSLNDPIWPGGGLVVLKGNLAPDGALIKAAAATPGLFETDGRAVVFDGLQDLISRIDDPALDVEPNDFLLLKNVGPVGAGMPEAGYLPIPRKLARQGVKDMVRISDARMSGTAAGTIVLHVAPEAAIGGTIAAVQNGDRIRLSIAEKRLDLLVDQTEIEKRLRAFLPPPGPARGYQALYHRSVLQAPQGCDFDFLVGSKS
ncbi:MAG: dihydroxy-acid dehydratase [Proteobacteria bacterium]|nr:dihydroxy-acid dehydratase [Pseudomonadota bacterium]